MFKDTMHFYFHANPIFKKNPKHPPKNKTKQRTPPPPKKKTPNNNNNKTKTKQDKTNSKKIQNIKTHIHVID